MRGQNRKNKKTAAVITPKPGDGYANALTDFNFMASAVMLP
jgi:hypothetical protein